MTPDDLHKAILMTLKQVRAVWNEQGRKRANMDVKIYGNAVASDEMLDDMSRNVAQALVILIDCAGGGPCPSCGSSYVGPVESVGPCCSLCGAVV